MAWSQSTEDERLCKCHALAYVDMQLCMGKRTYNVRRSMTKYDYDNTAWLKIDQVVHPCFLECADQIEYFWQAWGACFSLCFQPLLRLEIRHCYCGLTWRFGKRNDPIEISFKVWFILSAGSMKHFFGKQSLRISHDVVAFHRDEAYGNLVQTINCQSFSPLSIFLSLSLLLCVCVESAIESEFPSLEQW